MSETRPKPKKWTNPEQDYLRAHWKKTATSAIAEHLGRSEMSITARANILNLSTMTDKKDNRTVEEIQAKKHTPVYSYYLTTRFGFESEGYTPFYTCR